MMVMMIKMVMIKTKTTLKLPHLVFMSKLFWKIFSNHTWLNSYFLSGSFSSKEIISHFVACYLNKSLVVKS